jgi:penicillin-binding protein 2
MSDVQQRIHNRSLWLTGIAGAVLLLLSSQLYRLTVAQSASWRGQAEGQMWREIKSHGPRGEIVDRNEMPLAVSEISYSAVLLEHDLKQADRYLPELALVLTGHDAAAAEKLVADTRQKMKERKEQWRQYEPLTIKRKLDLKVVSEFADRKSEFPGVILVTEGVRKYPQGALGGAVIGYVGAISAEELKSDYFKEYGADELVGKDGLERAYEHELRGREGKIGVAVDPWGRPMSGYEITPALPGNKLQVTLDVKLQKVLEDALVRQIEWIKAQNDKEARPTRGAAVVQDVNTGAILAMASYPTFDPNWFATGLSQEQADQLFGNPLGPLNNWAMAAFEPGSTYKMGVGLAALENGVLGPYQKIPCSPTYFRDPTRKNWAPYDQGPADVARALALSCNPYFYEAGYLLGIDRLHDFVDQFGFGKPTGIDLPNEEPGKNPTKASYGDRWQEGQALSVGIGQGDVRVTPLQLVNYTATIAKSGVRYKPHLIQRILSPSGEVLKEYQPEKLPPVQASPAHWARIQEGMRQAVTAPDGTGHLAFLGFPVPVAAKTGSAETGKQWANALTVAYAPYDNPQIAVSVIVEGGAHGSWVAPVARAAFAQYFGVKDQIPPGVPTYRTADAQQTKPN